MALGAALILALFGFVLGALLSSILYGMIASASFLPLCMETARAVAVFVPIFAMCAIAGLLAMRKRRDGDPADMF